jgi:hypothetical protein
MDAALGLQRQHQVRVVLLLLLCCFAAATAVAAVSWLALSWRKMLSFVW